MTWERFLATISIMYLVSYLQTMEGAGVPRYSVVCVTTTRVHMDSWKHCTTSADIMILFVVHFEFCLHTALHAALPVGGIYALVQICYLLIS